MLNKIIKEGSKHGLCEAVIIKTNNANVDFSNTALKKIEEGTQNNLVIRIITKNGFGTSSTNNLDNWKECINTALKIARFSKDKTLNEIPKKSVFKSPMLYATSLKKLPSEKLIDKCYLSIDSASKYEGLRVQEAGISRTIMSKEFLNSNGVKSVYDKALISLEMSTCSNNITADYGISSTKIPDFKNFGIKVAELNETIKKQVRIPTKKMSIILDPMAVNEIFSYGLINSFYADKVQEGRSMLAGRVGEEVFSSELSITDDGTMPYGINTGKCDAEGSACQKTVLVNKGVLKGYLYDFVSAKKENKKSTGNCSSLLMRPSISCTNFVIKPGSMSREELIQETKEGVYVTHPFNVSSINPVSGEFSNRIHASYYIKNGRIMGGVKQGMISGTVFNLLKNISGISKKQPQYFGIHSPILKFDDVQVIG